MKKVLPIILISILLGLSGSFVVLNNSNLDPRVLICHLRGGEYFWHAFGSSCELPASDGGKECIYNEECSLRSCEYQDLNTEFNCETCYNLVPKPELKGHCDTYSGDDDGVPQCTRPSGSDEFQCMWFVS